MRIRNRHRGESSDHLGRFRARRQGLRGVAVACVAAIAAACSDPAAPQPLEQLPRELSAAERKLSAASNRFAFDLLREVDRLDGEGNVVLSPLSASLALGMTMNGAAGSTLEEMRSVLGFEDLELGPINESYRDLMALLLDLDGSVDMRVANSIWYRDGVQFEDSFFGVARDYFSAEVTGIRMAPGDAARIDAWVRRATAGKIPQIVEEIQPHEVMFLINAVYFKGEWTRRFDPSRTRDLPFHHEDGTTSQVKMMQGDGPFQHAWTEAFSLIELPYGNGAFAMTILLPAPGHSVTEVAASLDEQTWQAAVASMRESRSELVLPRFRLEYEQDLGEALQALGMHAAFRGGVADFSGMSSTHGGELFITRVKQKTFVEVNEEGTEAAAATSVGVGLVSTPQQLRVDRPFLFAIRERFSGTILFLGKVVDPS